MAASLHLVAELPGGVDDVALAAAARTVAIPDVLAGAVRTLAGLAHHR